MFCTNCGKELPDGSKFCTNCGAKITPPHQKAATEQSMQTQEKDTSKQPQDQSISFEAVNDFDVGTSNRTDETDTVRQIIGKHADYYLSQFAQMRQGANSKMNWASFFFSLCHAGYRNVWREWLRAVRLPLILSLGMQLLGVVLSFIWLIPGNIVACLSTPFTIWFWVASILFSKNFNRIYMEHVERKLSQQDFRPDPSGGRAVLTYLASFGAYSIIAGVLSIALLSGIINTWTSEDQTVAEDTLPDDAIVEPNVPQTPDEENTDASNSPTINLNDYTGSWMVDRFNSYMDGYVGFTIENANDQFYFSANGVWNQGDRVNNIDYALIELNYEGSQAGGYYEDGRGNFGDIILDFENGELYLTITAQGSGDYSFGMEHEHCTRDAASEQSNEQNNLVDEMNVTEFRSINVFLSNFSEVDFAYDEPYQQFDQGRILDFAVLHNLHNNPEQIHYTGDEMYISADTVAQTAQKYFHVVLQHQSAGNYSYRDGNYYCPAIGWIPPAISSVATDMYDNGDQTYTVYFSVFEGPFDTVMTPYYSYTYEQAIADTSLTLRSSGMAQLGQNNDGTYYLIQYEVY